MYLTLFTFFGFFITFLFCTSCGSTKIHDEQSPVTDSIIKITKEIKPSANNYLLKEGKYSANLNNCLIQWQVNEVKDTKNIEIFYHQLN